MGTRKRFDGKTVVITGASSGLGRGCALAFAKEGANLGLIARSSDGLSSLAAEIRSLGQKAMTSPIDVTDYPALEKAADSIAKEFGGIDVWVNGAAVAVYGEVDKVPLEEFRRVMDVNFFGQLHGIRVSLPYLENAPGGGRLIGISSALARGSIPLQSTYVASKHAIDGLYICLQEELIHRKSRVKVSTILASSIDTPMFDHAKTYTGFRPKPLPPVYPVERYVDIVLDEALKPHGERIVGGFAHVAIPIGQLVPRFARWYQGKTGYKAQRSREPKGSSDGDNLFSPMSGTSTIHGPVPASRTINAVETQIRPALLITSLFAAVWFLMRRRVSRTKNRDRPMPGQQDQAA